MDPTETARAVMTRHHPRRLLAALHILRCARRGCGAWPCEHWTLADAEKRRIETQLAVERITDMIGHRPDPVADAVTPNRGAW